MLRKPFKKNLNFWQVGIFRESTNVVLFQLTPANSLSYLPLVQTPSNPTSHPWQLMKTEGWAPKRQERRVPASSWNCFCGLYVLRNNLMFVIKAFLIGPRRIIELELNGDLLLQNEWFPDLEWFEREETCMQHLQLNMTVSFYQLSWKLSGEVASHCLFHRLGK